MCQEHVNYYKEEWCHTLQAQEPLIQSKISPNLSPGCWMLSSTCLMQEKKRKTIAQQHKQRQTSRQTHTNNTAWKRQEQNRSSEKITLLSKVGVKLKDCSHLNI